MTTQVGVFEAKTRLSELVDQVASGREGVVITKRGKPVARLTATASEASTIKDALSLLLAARGASMAGRGTLRDLIDYGRSR